MSQEPALTIEQLAEVLKIPESLLRSYQDQGMLPQAVATENPDVSEPKYLRSDTVQALRKYPEAMDAIRRAIRTLD